MSAFSKLLTVVGYFVGAFTGQWYVFAAGLSSQYQERQQARAQRRAIAEYNAALKDRLEMVDLLPDAPRSLVLGRVRYVEGVRRRWVSGTNSEKLTLVVSYAGHEIDAFEQWYIDDTPVTLDAAGWVITAPWVKGTLTSHTTFIGETAATVDLGMVPAGQVLMSWEGSETFGFGPGSVAAASISGTVATFPYGAPTGGASVAWQTADNTSRVRIRAWRGAPGQNVGAAIAADYPGKITASDRFEGIAVAAIDMLYDQDVFAQGRPNITCVMRGARVLDPRSGATAWSDNPALLANHYARWASGYGLPADEINTDDVRQAADICDISTNFTLRDSAGATSAVTLPRYRCGIAITSKTSPREAMDDILASMAGRAGWAGGIWRLRAGAMASPVFDITPDWLARPLDEAGQPDTGPVVRWSNGVTRDGKVNRVTGTCVDQAQRWQSLPFPAVQDAALIAAQGEYQAEVVLPGVTHIAHAQHLGTVMIRENQAALRGELSCNLNAYRCELFDVGRLLLPRYGMTEALGKTVEVIGWRWHPTIGVQLTVAEIAAALYTPVAELTGRDPAPNSALPPLGQVEQLTITGVTSGTAPLTDGSVITRTRIAWGAAVAEAIRANGQIEVQYTEASATLPDGDWPSWLEGGSATDATIPGLRAGRWYLFRVRALKPSLGVRGRWSAQAAHLVAEPPADLVKYLRLKATALAMRYPAGGGVPTPASVTLTAELGGALTGTATWAVVSGTATLGGSGNTRTLAAADMATDAVTISATIGSYVDTLTIVKLYDGATGPAGPAGSTGPAGAAGSTGATGAAGAAGADAVAGVLTNEAIVLPADAAGAVTSYAGASSQLLVFIGSAETGASWSFSRANGAGVDSTLTGSTLTVTSLGAGTDASWVDITAARAGYSPIIKRLYVSKARAGAAGATGSPGTTGATGPAGAAGVRGATRTSRAVGTIGWSDSEANAAIGDLGLSPVNFDEVTLYRTAGDWAQSRYYVSGAWLTINYLIDGNLLVRGSVGADRLVTNSIETQYLKLGAVSANQVQDEQTGGGVWPNSAADFDAIPASADVSLSLATTGGLLRAVARCIIEVAVPTSSTVVAVGMDAYLSIVRASDGTFIFSDKASLSGVVATRPGFSSSTVVKAVSFNPTFHILRALPFADTWKLRITIFRVRGYSSAGTQVAPGAGSLVNTYSTIGIQEIKV